MRKPHRTRARAKKNAAPRSVLSRFSKRRAETSPAPGLRLTPVRAHSHTRPSLSLSFSYSSDEENPYLRAAPPSAPQRSLAARVVEDVRARWWLWGAALFAAALATTLVAFRGQLYDLSARGMPLLAVKGNAAEACTTMCEDAVAEAAKGAGGTSAAAVSAAATTAAGGAPTSASVSESFEACYAKCVAQETKDVAREREEFKKEEAEIEKEEAADKAAAEKAAAEKAAAAAKPAVVAAAAAKPAAPVAKPAEAAAAPKP